MIYAKFAEPARVELPTGTILNYGQTKVLLKQIESWIVIEEALRKGLDSWELDYITTDLCTNYEAPNGMEALHALIRYDILVDGAIATVHLQFDQVEDTMLLRKELDETATGFKPSKDEMIVVDKSMRRYLAGKIVNPDNLQPRGFFFWYSKTSVLSYSVCSMIAYNQGYGYQNCALVQGIWTGAFSMIYSMVSLSRPATVELPAGATTKAVAGFKTFQQFNLVKEALSNGLACSLFEYKTSYVNPVAVNGTIVPVASFRYDIIVNDAVASRVHVQIDSIKPSTSSLKDLDDTCQIDSIKPSTASLKDLDDTCLTDTSSEASIDVGNEIGQSTKLEFAVATGYDPALDVFETNDISPDAYNYPAITTNQCVASKAHNSGDIFEVSNTCPVSTCRDAEDFR